MKYYLIIFLFISCQLSGQLKENFENCDFNTWDESVSGRWSISAIKPINGNYSLQHSFDNILSDHDQISLQHNQLLLDSGSVCWKFKIRHEYDPSSYNNWAVFLAADKSAVSMHPSERINAFILGVNYQGSDDYVKLWKSSGNSVTEVLSTSFNWQSEIGTLKSAEFEVIRERNGIWKIHVKVVDALSDNVFIIETPDTTGLKVSSYFGLYYKYSSAQDQKLWFDDLEITGYFICDTISPRLNGISVPNQHNILLNFNENICISGNTKIEIHTGSELVKIDSLSVSARNLILWLANPVPNEIAFKVKIYNVSDIYGNLNQSDSLTYFFYQPRFNDIIVTEIMADPSPPVLLPEAEYIEILNRSNYPLSLEGWQICVGNSCASIGSYTILSGNYLVLCHKNSVELFSGVPALLGLDRFPQVSNAGQVILIKDNNSHTVFSIKYSNKWYSDNSKSDGGWSLEIIDTDNPCGGSENWKASLDIKGGTPGYPNSVLSANPDINSPELLKCIIINDTSLYLHFNEIVTGEFIYEPKTYYIDNGLGNPYLVLSVNNLPFSRILYFKKPFKEKLPYTLQVKNDITDCAGNILERNISYTFRKPSGCDSLDIIINEILFDPYEPGGDFIEIYNRSEKTIDLKDFSMALKNPYTEKITSRSYLATFPFTIEPGNYLVLSKSVALITKYYTWYSLNSFLEMDNFPILPNESGIVVLADANNRVIDEVPYMQKMHMEIAVNTKGISLERINGEQPSNHSENWYSASTDAGYATPGYVNSQNENDDLTINISIEPGLFSPYGDGYYYETTIYYRVSDAGYIANITVFDRTGRPVKKVTRNAILGISGEFTWNGRNDENRIVPVGPYMILTEIYNLSGTIKIFKNACIIAEKIY